MSEKWQRTVTSDELIQEIAETLRLGDGEFIANIANQVLVPTITYDGDSFFSQTIVDDGWKELP